VYGYQKSLIFIMVMFSANLARAGGVIELSASPFDTANAPISEYIKSSGEKVIVVDPREHIYGAYNAHGKLVRWGLATAGSDDCRDSNGSCRTHQGVYRIYSAGTAGCVSKKYPLPDGGASMPFCMYFNGGEAIHGSNEIEYDNVSHGCVRVHVDDAEWLRYRFVEAPSRQNGFQGTKVVIKSY
jgi:hypothetical protein